MYVYKICGKIYEKSIKMAQKMNKTPANPLAIACEMCYNNCIRIKRIQTQNRLNYIRRSSYRESGVYEKKVVPH